MSPAYVGRRLAEALPDDVILFSELGCDPAVMNFTQPGSYFGFPPSGGLGFGLPAALGAKLAHPDRTVVATVGDGSSATSIGVDANDAGRIAEGR